MKARKVYMQFDRKCLAATVWDMKKIGLEGMASISHVTNCRCPKYGPPNDKRFTFKHNGMEMEVWAETEARAIEILRSRGIVLQTTQVVVEVRESVKVPII